MSFLYFSSISCLFFQSSGKKTSKTHIKEIHVYCTLSICIFQSQSISLEFFLLQKANVTYLFLSIFWRFVHISFTLIFTPKNVVKMCLFGCLFSVCWQYFLIYGVKINPESGKTLLYNSNMTTKSNYNYGLHPKFRLILVKCMQISAYLIRRCLICIFKHDIFFCSS